MAKRGQRYPYRVRYVWTSGLKGTVVASSLDEAELKADKIEAAGLRRDDSDVEVTIATADGSTVRTRNTAAVR